MPEPQPHQATCTGGVSVFPPLAHIGLARLTCRCLLKACRSVAQALEHEGIRDATGTEVSVSAQERAMPEPQPHQATCRAVFIVSYYNQILLVYSSRARARLFGHCVHICSKRSF